MLYFEYIFVYPKIEKKEKLASERVEDEAYR